MVNFWSIPVCIPLCTFVLQPLHWWNPQMVWKWKYSLHFHLSPAYISLKIIILWPSSFLVFHKILSIIPSSDRKMCLILPYLMSALSRLFVIPIWEMYFISQKLAPLWSCIEMNLRTSFIPILYYSVLFSSLSFCLFVFFSSKITSFAFFTLYALFPNEGGTFFPLQVLCSALNHDLPMHVFWGISVSNW